MTRAPLLLQDWDVVVGENARSRSRGKGWTIVLGAIAGGEKVYR